jgi:outer membrane protein assembly factor BamA
MNPPPLIERVHFMDPGGINPAPLAVFAVYAKGVLAALTCAAALAAALLSAQDAPVIRNIEVRGGTVYDLQAIERILRLKPGSPLRRPASDLAEMLERRYHILGFPAARVEGRFDPETGTLAFDVDEGRLATVEVEGLEGDTEARVLKLLDFRPGKPVKERDISSALVRLEKLSQGAFVTTAEPPYSFEPGPEGVKLTLLLRRRLAGLQLRPGGPATASLYNRVDGFNLGANARLTLFDPVSFDHAEAYAQGAYGFSSHTLRYALGALKPFGPDRQFVVGYEYHDLTDNDDAFRRRTVEDLPGAKVYFNLFEDYYRRRGHQAYAFARATSRFQIGAGWRSDEYRTLTARADNQPLFSNDRTDNVPITEGRMRSVIGTARWSWKSDLFTSWSDERESLLMRNLYGTTFEREQQARVEATFEVATAGLGSDFAFRRFIGQARAAHVFSPRQSLLLRGLVGVSTGDVPLQRQFSLGGVGTLRGYERKQFAGDQMLLGTVEYWLYPRSPWPGLVFFYDGGKAWFRDRELPGLGWKSDVGAGLEWPGGGRGYLRFDVGFPLNREPSNKRAYVTGLLRLPF